MSFKYPLDDNINLFVEGRIARDDADRQVKTAKAILQRLEDQPGVILADEVGMGKTFVGLAVAVSVALNDRKRRPVVVMVPPALQNKWPNDFELFKERCLPDSLREELRYGVAVKGVQFLKLLDDPVHRRKSIIFVTHGAMSRGLTDGWVKLAMIHQALRYRKDADTTRRNVSKFLAELLRMYWVEKNGQDIWIELLKSPPADWLEILHEWGIDPENDNDPLTDDDPVPGAVSEVLHTLDTDDLYDVLLNMPKRRSDYIHQRIKAARKALNKSVRSLWGICVTNLDLKLPMLILDEAHHLKNASTRLASLFHIPEARDDIDEITKGALGGVFERMLFLTATPFQLGHGELCSVLDRFTGISWNHRTAPEGGRKAYQCALDELRRTLDAAQEAALSLDITWGRLGEEDLVIDGENYKEAGTWWNDIKGDSSLSGAAENVVSCYERTKKRMMEAEELLKPWVIRHLKKKFLPEPNDTIPRRLRFCGKSILDDSTTSEGLGVSGEALLPFLLAARATAQTPDSRPVFAEGLASSYEAYLNTRRIREQKETGSSATDSDDDAEEPIRIIDAQRWYLDRLEGCIPRDTDTSIVVHPKLLPTVGKVANLWRSGEKVVVFCHYVATGKVLRQKISGAIEAEIKKMGAANLGCAESEAMEILDRLGKRFFDKESPIRNACNTEVGLILKDFPNLQKYSERLIEIVRRNMRTPSFLVRYFSLRGQRLDEASMRVALEKSDASGMSLSRLIEDFFIFLDTRCSDHEKEAYIDALDQIQTGGHWGTDVVSEYSDDEQRSRTHAKYLPNVRLVNGSTAQETRQRLMLTFNTPFYPEILIASSVMAEGVDLHLNCRYVIHHDLCWNPSTLEQRTGRVDRIGAKIEVCGQSLMVYLPYLSETQDEKMFRVVMDREKWFKFVMGEKYKMDAKTTDKMADRIPFPDEAAQRIAFALEV